MEKHPVDVFYRKRYSSKFRNIYGKKPMSEPMFNKFEYLQSFNFIKKRPQYVRFPVNVAKFLRRTFLVKYLRTTASGHV